MNRANRSLIRAACALLAFAAASSPSAARQWNPDPRGAAIDYAQIVHARPSGDFTVIWWVVPEMFPAAANTQALRDVLSRYVVIGMVRGRTGANGASTFEAVDNLTITDSTSRPLSPLAANAIPAAAASSLAPMQTQLRQTLGAMGQGLRWFVFDGSTIHSCAAGKVSVPFQGETYTYDTPIPGCPK
jgi:hypothetical protein